MFNHCTVPIFRLTDLIEAINEKVKLGCTGIVFTCSCPRANMKEQPVQPFNNILLIRCACYKTGLCYMTGEAQPIMADP